MISLIEKCRTSDEYHTHVSMSHPKGKLVFDRPVVDAFWLEYSNFVYEGETLHLAEKLQGFIPVLVDIDLKVEFTEDKTQLYTVDQLKNIVRNYQDVLKNILADCKPENLYCFVLEKPSYKVEAGGKEYIKNGFHLQFINTFLTKNDHENHLIPRVRKRVNKDQTFKSLGFERSGDLIDGCVTRNPWLMYGSSKAEGMIPYKLTKIYNEKLDIISLEDATKNYELYDSNEDLIPMTNPIFLLPRILSVIPWHRKASTLHSNLQSVVKVNPIVQEEEEEDDEDEDKQNERSKQIELGLQHVKKERFKDYLPWIQLCGMMVKNKLSRNLFLQYSKESGYTPFDSVKCSEEWFKVVEKKSKTACGFPTIKKWLEEDGIDWKQFLQDKKEDSGLLKEILNGWNAQGEFTDFNMATALYNAYKDNLIYTSQGWFHYTNGWVLGPEESIFHPIIKLLTIDLLAYVEDKQQKCLQRMKAKDNLSEQDKEIALSKLLKKMKSAVNKLQSASKIKSILEISKSIFRDDNALDTFDQKPNWFCFKNQIAWDLKTKKIINIEAKDRILTTCGYDFPERKEADIKIVNDLFQQITPNLKSLLSALSLYMYGVNFNELFIVFLGEGRNGKGLTTDILQLVLGNYYYSMPTEILTEQSKGKGQASPELAQARWARCCMGSEPDEGKTIVKTQLNMLTGREKITVRALHRDPFSYQPSFTMGLMCNVVLNVAGGINDAIKERMKIQTFPYTFVDEPTQDHHRQKNSQLKDQVKTNVSYRNGLLFLLLDTWFENQGKYISCEDSKEQETSYAKQNNPLTDFLTDYESSTDFIRISELLKVYNSSALAPLSIQKFKGFLEQSKVKIVIDKSNGHKCFLKKK